MYKAISAFKATRISWVLFVALLVACIGCGPNESPVQSSDIRLDLDIIGPVQKAGSDWRSRKFQRNLLPELIVFASEQLNSPAIRQSFAHIKLDPAELRLAERSRVRVYFASEDGFRNTLGVNLESMGVENGNPRIVFPDTAAHRNLYETADLVNRETMTLDESALAERSQEAPLWPGDFVDLGTLEADTLLGFFLINSKSEVFTVDPAANPDGVVHAVAIAIEDTPYLLLGFEDQWKGGDRDHSDCVLLVELSHSNIEALIGKIDPWRRAKEILVMATISVVIIGVLAVVFFLLRRAKRARDAHETRLVQRVTALLDNAQPEEALEIIRSRARRSSRPKQPWPDLEVRALERLDALADLAALESKSSDAFANHESASLKVARIYVETEQWESFSRLRDSWRTRDASAGEWVALEADALIKQDQLNAARTLLDAASFEKEKDCARLLRLALLAAPLKPDKARKLVERAHELAPERPDVHLFRARVMEQTGENESAFAGYTKALALAPRDPFIRDHLAEFYRRRGDFTRALQTWQEGLAAPSMDFLWTKVAFWRKMAFPMRLDWPTQQPSDSPLLALTGFIRSLPPGRFWDEPRFAALAEAHPSLGARQEVFWLRLLEALRVRREDDALTWLNLSRFGQQSWHAELEVALLHIISYRKLGFLDPQIAAAEPESPSHHPLFVELHNWATGQFDEPPRDTERLIQGEEAFAAALVAAGWDEAALQLRRVPLSASEYPRWYIDTLVDALRRNRGEAAAKEFVDGLGPR